MEFHLRGKVWNIRPYLLCFLVRNIKSANLNSNLGDRSIKSVILFSTGHFFTAVRNKQNVLSVERKLNKY